MTDSIIPTANCAFPLVSVLLPVYNAALYLQESIDSVLSQTYPHFELLLYDDGSTDGSASIIAAAAAADSRVVALGGATNYGLVAQLNAGIARAQGTYIARLDADDLAHPERLARQVAYLEAHPEVGLCGSAVRMFGTGIETFAHLPVENIAIRYTLCWHNAFFHPAVTLRRQVLLDHGLRYREEYMTAEDYQLWCELSLVTQLHNLPEVLLNYRIHPQQITRIQSIRGQQTTARIQREQMARFGIVLTPDQEQTLELLNAPRQYRHLRLADYRNISALLRALYVQVEGLEARAAARDVLSYQWYEVKQAAGHYHPALLPVLLQHPLGDRPSKPDVALVAKCLVGWRPNLLTYLKRYWRQRLRLY